MLVMCDGEFDAKKYITLYSNELGYTKFSENCTVRLIRDPPYTDINEWFGNTPDITALVFHSEYLVNSRRTYLYPMGSSFWYKFTVFCFSSENTAILFKLRFIEYISLMPLAIIPDYMAMEL